MVSDYRERTNKRRDERQAKISVRPPGGSKKDTKRWCRGRVGVEHKPVCVDYAAHKRTGWFKWPYEWKLLICSECKRELATWMPFPWLKDEKKPPPDWVR